MPRTVPRSGVRLRGRPGIVFTPPTHVTDAEVLDAVRQHWETSSALVAYVPAGFGAHHWRVGDLFVTLDGTGPRHTAATLEATYAAAAALAAGGLEFVLAPMPSDGGTCTVPLAGGLLSVTPWLDAPRAERPADRGLLDRLHAAAPPSGLRRWRPLVGTGLADELASRTARRWDSGPHGEAARVAIRTGLDALARWTALYHRLASGADPGTWVATHGEPHERNLLASTRGPVLVDWESLMLAPRERDLRAAGHPGNPAMLEMFDLEWRLDEVAQYATWFEQPHGDSEDDRTALGGLRHELARG